MQTIYIGGEKIKLLTVQETAALLGVSERTARARLMEMMYRLGKEKGIPARRLRFKINGIDE